MITPSVESNKLRSDEEILVLSGELSPFFCRLLDADNGRQQALIEGAASAISGRRDACLLGRT